MICYVPYSNLVSCLPMTVNTDLKLVPFAVIWCRV